MQSFSSPVLGSGIDLAGAAEARQGVVHSEALQSEMHFSHLDGCSGRTHPGFRNIMKPTMTIWNMADEYRGTFRPRIRPCECTAETSKAAELSVSGECKPLHTDHDTRQNPCHRLVPWPASESCFSCLRQKSRLDSRISAILSVASRSTPTLLNKDIYMCRRADITSARHGHCRVLSLPNQRRSAR
jgi:hypothetical protein